MDLFSKFYKCNVLDPIRCEKQGHHWCGEETEVPDDAAPVYDGDYVLTDTCLPKMFKCDGYRECSDNSDEENCSG